MQGGPYLQQGEGLSGVKGCWRWTDRHPSHPGELGEKVPMKAGPVGNSYAEEEDYSFYEAAGLILFV